MTTQKGFAPILMLLLIGIALVAAGGAYYFGFDHDWEKSVKLPTSQTISIPAPTDETTNWKTYTDPSGSFTFKYPDTLRLKSPEISVVDIEPNIVAEDNGRPLVEGRDDEIFRLIIAVREDPKIKNNPDLRESIL